MSRAAAARSAGMDRRALRDAVAGHAAEGPDGLDDRPTSGRPTPTEAKSALLSTRVFRGPDPETDGADSRTPPELRRRIGERFQKRPPPQSLAGRGRLRTGGGLAAHPEVRGVPALTFPLDQGRAELEFSGWA